MWIALDSSAEYDSCTITPDVIPLTHDPVVQVQVHAGAVRGQAAEKVQKAILTVAECKLAQLEAAQTLGFLKAPPGNRLEALKGDRKG